MRVVGWPANHNHCSKDWTGEREGSYAGDTLHYCTAATVAYTMQASYDRTDLAMSTHVWIARVIQLLWRCRAVLKCCRLLSAHRLCNTFGGAEHSASKHDALACTRLYHVWETLLNMVEGRTFLLLDTHFYNFLASSWMRAKFAMRMPLNLRLWP
jgi:hypothetical protein